MYKFQYKCSDNLDPTVTIKNSSTDSCSWSDQARDFFHFLLAQGFILSENDLANYYKNAAEEMMDLRSNTKKKNKVAKT